MVTVEIASQVLKAEEVSEAWLTQLVRRLRADHVPLCVRVNVDTDLVKVALCSGGCPVRSGSGYGRPATPQEREVMKLWQDLGLNEADFPPGKLVAFLKRVA